MPGKKDTTPEAEALRHYDHLLMLDGIYGRRQLNDWEAERFCQLSKEAICQENQ